MLLWAEMGGEKQGGRYALLGAIAHGAVSPDRGGRPGALWGLFCTWHLRGALWALLGALSPRQFRFPELRCPHDNFLIFEQRASESNH